MASDISLEDFRTHDKPFESATKLDFVLNFKARHVSEHACMFISQSDVCTKRIVFPTVL